MKNIIFGLILLAIGIGAIVLGFFGKVTDSRTKKPTNKIIVYLVGGVFALVGILIVTGIIKPKPGRSSMRFGGSRRRYRDRYDDRYHRRRGDTGGLTINL